MCVVLYFLVIDVYNSLFYLCFKIDVEAYSGCGTVDYPIIGDSEREVAGAFYMLDPDEKDLVGMPVTCRSVFVIGPDLKVKLSITYPPATGRNFHEILRVIDSLQLSAYQKVATPVNWVAGEDTVILPGISDEEAKTKFPKGFKTVELPSGKGYLRMTPDPREATA